MIQVILEKLIVDQLVNKFPAFPATTRFIAVFWSDQNWFLSCARRRHHQITVFSDLF